MRHRNVSTTVNMYGNSTRHAKKQSRSKVVEMVMRHEQPDVETKRMAV